MLGCASNKPPTNKPLQLGANYQILTDQYVYCENESCVQPTKLEPYTPDDFKIIEPESIPVVIVNTEPSHQKPTKKISHSYRKKKLKRRKANSNPKWQTRCFVINNNESGDLIISGNKLLQVTPKEQKTINSIESSLNNTSPPAVKP